MDRDTNSWTGKSNYGQGGQLMDPEMNFADGDVALHLRDLELKTEPFNRFWVAG